MERSRHTGAKGHHAPTLTLAMGALVSVIILMAFYLEGGNGGYERTKPNERGDDVSNRARHAPLLPLNPADGSLRGAEREPPYELPTFLTPPPPTVLALEQPAAAGSAVDMQAKTLEVSK